MKEAIGFLAIVAASWMVFPALGLAVLGIGLMVWGNAPKPKSKPQPPEEPTK